MDHKIGYDPGMKLVLKVNCLVKGLRELGICFDENGRLRHVKNNELITMSNLNVDPLLTIAAITQYVCIYE